jgi:hypothetical protein
MSLLHLASREEANFDLFLYNLLIGARYVFIVMFRLIAIVHIVLIINI